MKILCWPAGNINSEPQTALEYLTGMVIHGGRRLLGSDFVDWPHYDCLYKNYPDNKKWNLYGRGFSLPCTLDEEPIDREDIGGKLSTNYFQYVIVPVHTTVNQGGNQEIYQHIDHILALNPHQKILFVDTLDSDIVAWPNLIGKVAYFKRERLDHTTLPISYSFPAEKIIDKLPAKYLKAKDWSQIIPWETGMIFDTEESYYANYKESYFAYTVRKGNWNCNRTLEIMANGCLPWFGGIENCPDTTMSDYPKLLFHKIRQMPGINAQHGSRPNRLGEIDWVNFDENQYWDYVGSMLDYTRGNLTTEAAFKRMLETAKSHYKD
jgi:hypothetical protein